VNVSLDIEVPTGPPATEQAVIASEHQDRHVSQLRTNAVQRLELLPNDFDVSLTVPYLTRIAVVGRQYLLGDDRKPQSQHGVEPVISVTIVTDAQKRPQVSAVH
jgi:hypothetical protein